jgi:hypothetical protein
MTETSSLRAVKAVHTAVWFVFASAIVAIAPLAVADHWSTTLWLVAAVIVECLVVALNRMRCPLTDVAERFTADRRANFDIYLPEWLARHNKTIFGAWFAADLIVLAVLWG